MPSITLHISSDSHGLDTLEVFLKSCFEEHHHVTGPPSELSIFFKILSLGILGSPVFLGCLVINFLLFPLYIHSLDYLIHCLNTIYMVLTPNISPAWLFSLTPTHVHYLIIISTCIFNKHLKPNVSNSGTLYMSFSLTGKCFALNVVSTTPTIQGFVQIFMKTDSSD